MGGFIEQLRLAEKAAEDIYFARIDRELIEALHRQLQAENSGQATDSPGIEAKAGGSPAI